MGKDADELTQNQELYCQARLRGLSQRAAYREAFPRSREWQDSTVDSKACILEGQGKVSARIAELNAQGAKAAGVTRSKLLSRLDGLADVSWERIRKAQERGDRIEYAAATALISATKELLPYAVDDVAERPAFSADFACLISPDFFRPHMLISRMAVTDVWLRGGRGSMKSSFASLEVVRWLETHPDHHALVMMRYKVDLKDAAYAQIVWAIAALGLADDYDMPESTLRIRKRSTGQLIIFKGCDNPKKVRSVKVPFGRIGVQWFEECDMFRGMAELRMVNQSVTRGEGDGMLRLYSFNPPRSATSWVNAEMQRRSEAGKPVFDSCYLNAPREWLGEQFVADAEELRAADEKAYRHEYLGEPVGIGLEVFDPERVVFRAVTDEEIAAFDNPHAGQDFGWYPDPWAMTVSEWRQSSRTLITWREDGGNKLQPAEQAERVRAALTWEDDPGAGPVYHHLPVLSDDADPTAIAAQKDAGVNARPAQKGGLRSASYRFIQSSTWVIDPVRCPRLAEEVRAQQYEVTKDGEVLNSIPDGNDHFIDATRYALMPLVRRARSAYRRE